MTVLMTVLLSLGLGLLSLGLGLLSLGLELTRIDLELTRIDLRIDLPHVSLLVPSQNTVSVIISCKTAKNVFVENTARNPRAEQMRSMSQKQLAAGHVGVSATLSRGAHRVYIRRHFVILTVKSIVWSKMTH